MDFLESNYVRQELIIEATIFLDSRPTLREVAAQEFKVVRENNGHCILMYLFQYILQFSKLCNHLWSLAIRRLPFY